MQFVGRTAHLALLDEEYAKVQESGAGRLLVMLGRRQVGKSTLVTEWLDRTRHPSAYLQATRRSPDRELRRFTEAIGESTLPSLPELVSSGTDFRSWEAAFRAVACTATAASASVLVIDELPYLTQVDDGFDATLQAAWDQHLRHAPVLLVVIGSNVSIMQGLSDYHQPLYGRVSRTVEVRPLTVREVGSLLGLDAVQAFDTYLITGGFPKVVQSWPRGASREEFIGQVTADASHPLLVTGERTVNAELPGDLKARAVLVAVGAGERTYTAISGSSEVAGNTLTRALAELAGKRIVAARTPLSAERRGKNTRYVVEDPYLRFWLRFLAPRLGDVERGRGDLVAAELLRGWTDFAGTAVEPLVRSAIERMLPDPRFGAARRVGGFWTRTNDPEVDLTATADERMPARLEFAGSVKWRERRTFRDADAAALASDAARVPGFDGRTILVGVSRTGFAPDVRLDVRLTPSDLIDAL